jgi:cytochrome b
MKSIKVWSWPIRLMHWSMVAAFVTAMWTRNSLFGQMIHIYAGEVMAVIVVLRLIYGITATDLAAFRQFPFSLAAGMKYFIAFFLGRAKRYLGHNPAAALAIYALLSVSMLTAVTGYVAFEFDYEIVKDWHHYLGYALFWLACVHVLGVIVVGVVQKEFLVKAMITGYKHED